MTNYLHLFLEDTLLTRIPEVNLGFATEPKFGYVSKEMLSYFSTRGAVQDPRATRLNVLGTVTDGEMTLVGDTALPDVHLFLSTLDETQRECFFNVVERVYLSTSSLVDLIDELETAPQYAGYVRDSLSISSVRYDLDVKITEADPDPTTLSIPSFIKFKFDNGSGEDDHITIWFSNEDFLASYPYGVVTKVLFPCDAKYFLDPNQYKSALDAVIENGSFIFSSADSIARQEDNSGVFTYSTRYNYSVKSTRSMPFGIVYKGKIPSTIKMREAIRAALEATGITTVAMWQQYFPDLYIDAQFYIIPIWSNITTRPDKKIFPSVVKLTHTEELMAHIFPDMDRTYLREHLELIQAGASELQALIIADPLNATITSFRDLHPTYVYHTSSRPGYIVQDESTREFNSRYNFCISALLGSELTSAYVPVDLDGRTYLTFVSGAVEYYVLMEESFPYDDFPIPFN